MVSVESSVVEGALEEREGLVERSASMARRIPVGGGETASVGDGHAAECLHLGEGAVARFVADLLSQEAAETAHVGAERRRASRDARSALLVPRPLEVNPALSRQLLDDRIQLVDREIHAVFEVQRLSGAEARPPSTAHPRDEPR